MKHSLLVNIRNLLLPLCLSALAVQAAEVGPFDQWPAGASPAEVGKRVAENYVARKFEYEIGKFPTLVYPEVCAWYGSFEVAKLTGDNDLQERLVRRYDRFLLPENNKYLRQSPHVDDSVTGVVPFEIYLLNKDKQYLAVGLKYADSQWDSPTEDGVTREARYWVDDIYMICSLQVQAFRSTGETRYLDRAALTVATYLDKLQQPNGLFQHAPDSPFYWGRGNGWYAAGMTELLSELPKNHPKYGRIMEGYQKMMASLLKYQSDTGLWRQLVDKQEAWLETSGSGMFAYAMVTGVKRGWLDAETYGPPARKAWLALVERLDAEANVKDVCVGTNKAALEVGPDVEKQLAFYLARERSTGDYHGQAPVLWTAAAMLRK